MPLASCRSQSARLPTVSRSSCGSAARTSTSRSMPRARSLRRRHRADAPQRVDRQLLQERLDPLRADHRQAVGLLPAGRDLREKLVRRDAGRRGQAGVARGCAAFSRFATAVAERLAPRVLGDVEVRLVERQRLDERRHLAEDREHRVRGRLVPREIGRHDDERRAEAHGRRHRHRRAHAERARFVAGGRDDAAAIRAGRRRPPAARAATGCRAARPTRRTRPCRCGGFGA